MIGNGYNSVRRCEFAEVPDDAEQDSGPWLCDFEEDADNGPSDAAIEEQMIEDQLQAEADQMIEDQIEEQAIEDQIEQQRRDEKHGLYPGRQDVSN